jgi:hypothetical protein
MLTIAAVLFAVAALGGISLATLHLRRKGLPMVLALGHGLLAVSGLVVLIVAVIGGSMGTVVNVSLAVFVIAALGGLALFSFHLRRQPLPTPVVFIHGLVAVIAFVLLVVRIARGG